MKKIIAYILSLTALASCVKSADEIFDKPASERVGEAIDNCRKILTDQTNGWLVEFFPEKTQKYGGFNLFFKFAGENAVVSSEIDPAASDTSVYEINSDMSVCINFVTYNPSLHYFSNPETRVGNTIGLGYEGDYEFIIVEASPSEIILMGKKTKNRIRMTPFPENIKWTDYCKTVEKIRSELRPQYSVVLNGKDTVLFDYRKGGFKISYKKDGANVTETVSYIFTDKGIKMYEPFEVAGKLFSEFTMQSDFNFASSGATLVAQTPPRWLPITAYEGNYTLTHNTIMDETGTVYTKNVTLTRDGKTDQFLLSGLMPSLELDVALFYEMGTGTLLVYQQPIYQFDNSNLLNFTAWDMETYLYPNALGTVGQYVRWDGVTAPIELEWVDYGEFPNPIGGFLLWITTADGRTNIGQYTSVPIDQRRWTYIKMKKQ
ncbi:MAG: DUF4302 domain-containing protein [Prevotellaceae bacterium]|jgi:hypothetical protein|nr:DUF4302 domain-containing protein [Prevotellaceae bacterium]